MSSHRSKSPTPAVRERHTHQHNDTVEDGINPYDRPVISAQHDSMIVEQRQLKLNELQRKLNPSGGAGVAVTFVEEMTEGKRFFDKFRIICTGGAGLRSQQHKLIESLVDQILPLNGSTSILFVLVDHRRYDTRPLRGFDLSNKQIILLLLLVCVASCFIGVALDGYIGRPHKGVVQQLFFGPTE
jgi:hypothetical protein